MKNTFKTCILVLIQLGIFSGSPVFSQPIDDLISGYYAHGRFMGTVKVLKDGKTVFDKGYGYSDIGNQKGSNNNTIYDLGSVTKTMTAVAILRLHDQGKLSIYDRVDKYIPGFVNDNSAEIRIINLLNHTSGISANLGRFDDDGKGIVLPGSDPVRLDDLIDRFRMAKLKDQPGKKFEYNNYGYTLLAYIIQKVSGMDYPEYLKKNIFRELKMSSTCYKPELKVQPAIGYEGIATDNFTQAKDQFHPSWIIGAGYMYSSTSDMVKFIDGVFSAKLFSVKTLRLMEDSCINAGKSDRWWALGWEKRIISGLNMYTHGGGIFGYSTRIGYIPEKNITIVILSNLTKTIRFDEIYSTRFSFVDEITENIVRLMNNQPVTLIPVPSGSPELYVGGEYKFDDLHSMNVSVRDNKAIISTQGGSNYSIFDYPIYRERSDSSGRIAVCGNFAKSMLKSDFTGLEIQTAEELRNALFSPKGLARLKAGWENFTTQSGDFISFNVYNIRDNNYDIAFHYMNTEILMKLSFNKNDQIQGIFFTRVLPKCKSFIVSLIPAGKDVYFIDGYRNGGYPDFIVRFDKAANTLTFSGESDIFTAKRLN